MTRLLLFALIFIAAAWCAATVGSSVTEEVWNVKSVANKLSTTQHIGSVPDIGENGKNSLPDGSMPITPQPTMHSLRTSGPDYVLVVHDLDGPPEAIQTEYVLWAMEALPLCADDDPDECLRMAAFIRGGAHVAFCESGQQPWKENNEGSGATGLFQTMRIHEWRFKRRGWTWEDAKDPVKNTIIAYELYRESGWGPWEICQWSIPR